MIVIFITLILFLGRFYLFDLNGRILLEYLYKKFNINAVYNFNKNVFYHSHIHATDEEFCHHRCPIFKGFVTTVSGFDSVDRKELQKAVEENGNFYSD